MTRRSEIVVWAATLLFAVAAIVGWRRTVPVVADAHMQLPSAHGAMPGPTSSELAVLASRVVERDPFRLERGPAGVAFGSAPLVPVASAPSTPRPTLLLSGVFGPPWQAVLEGIPGRQGSVVVRVGDAFGDLRIRSIRRDTVVVQSADTTLKLTVRRAW